MYVWYLQLEKVDFLARVLCVCHTFLLPNLIARRSRCRGRSRSHRIVLLTHLICFFSHFCQCFVHWNTPCIKQRYIPFSKPPQRCFPSRPFSPQLSSGCRFWLEFNSIAVHLLPLTLLILPFLSFSPPPFSHFFLSLSLSLFSFPSILLHTECVRNITYHHNTLTVTALQCTHKKYHGRRASALMS